MRRRLTRTEVADDALYVCQFPLVDAYIANEKEVVYWLSECTELAGLSDSFDTEIQRLKALVSEKRTKGKPYDLRFYATIDSEVEERCSVAYERPKTHKVGFGMVVKFDKNGILSFSSFVIEIFGEKSSDKHDQIMARIHFDVVSKSDRAKGKYPLYHIQVGGSPFEGKFYIGEHKDIKALSYPRIMSYPLSFALFIDMVFRELGNKEARQFLAGDEWRSQVRKSEQLIVVPFIEHLLARCKNNNKQLLSDVYYGSGVKA